MKDNIRSVMNYLIGVILALILAFFILSILLLWQGFNPFNVVVELFKGAFGGIQNFAASLVLATPLILGGLGIAISFRCGIFNIGGEGQIYLGALAGTMVGVYFGHLPAYLLIPLCLLASVIAGGLWALIPGYLKIKKGFNEVITSVLLNYVGVNFVNYTLASFFKDHSKLNHQSLPIGEGARLTKLVPGSELNTSFIIALFLSLLVYLVFYKTDWGFKLRMVGLNSEAARTSGVNISKYLLLAIIASGAFIGIAGSAQVMGYEYVLMQNFSPNTGYDVIAVALMGNLHPFGVVVAAIFMGALRNGTTVMQIMLGVPVTILGIIQGIVILCIVGFSRAQIDFIAKFVGLFNKNKKLHKLEA